MSAFRKPCLLVLGAALLLLATTPVLAQDDAAKEQAKQLFLQGSEHFKKGRFPEALTAFEQANAIKPHPLMLYNIGQVYEAMNELPRAVETYEKFLASGTDDQADVKERLARIRKTLASSWTLLELTSEPLGAMVWVGGKDKPPQGRTPVRIQVPAGTVTLILEKDGFRAVQRPVRLQAGKTEQLAIVLPPIMPVVSLRSTPAGARVSVDGSALGVTPLVRPLPPGKHTAVVEVEGRPPVTREFELGSAHTADAPLVVDVAFEGQAPTGFLDVAIDRDGAEVRVDGEKVGVTPLAGPIPLPAGAHRVEVHADGAQVHEETVVVAAGETARTEIELSGGSGGGISQRTLGFVAMGVGGAVMAAGGVFGVLAAGSSGDLDSCRGDAACNGTKEEESLADDVRSQALLTDVLIGGGIAIAATGAVLWLLSDGEPAAASGGPTFGIAPTPGGATAVGIFEF